MPSIEKLSRAQLENALVRARERAAKAESALRDAPADVELLRAANKRLLKKARKQEGLSSLILDTVKSAVAEQDFSMKLPPPIKFLPSSEETKALLHITDTQIGKKTASYSTAIARERILEVCRKAVSCIQNHNRARGVRELHVLLGGDMIENETIYAHQAHEIDNSALVQTMVSVPTIFRDALMYMHPYFEKIKVYCQYGNHGRIGPFGGSNNPESNLDIMAYMMMREMLQRSLIESGIKGHTIDVKITRDFFIVDNDLFDHHPLLVHGDHGIKGGMGGFPYYGVGRAVSKWSVSIPDPWKVLFFGHFHGWKQGEDFARAWYCGGTLESGNGYARASFDASGRPKQRLLFYTKKQMVCELPIYANSSFTGMGFGDPKKGLI